MSFKDSSYSALKVRRQKQKQSTKISSICILFKVTYFSSMGQRLFKIEDLFEHLVTSQCGIYMKNKICDLFPIFFFFFGVDKKQSLMIIVASELQSLVFKDKLQQD